jgi:uncharacterized protein YjbJ (UPF0337 family)
MDKNRIKGTVKQVKGAAEETAGKLLGDDKLAAQGNADKTSGKIQSTVGRVKDALKK